MDATIEKTVRKALEKPKNLSVDELAHLVAAPEGDEAGYVRSQAYALKVRYCGKKVSMRGIVELGNVCAKDCYYCGIRKSNASLSRYSMSADEIVAAAEENARMGYASLVLQGGEIESEANTRFIEECLERIRSLDLGVTLSLGEQDESVYRRWKAAGASRYLLRIESSNPLIYARLHPGTHSWNRRAKCLASLKRLGYQVGSGSMSALPGQSFSDMARDIVFLGDIDVDMVGMGPYIPHPDTPMGREPETIDDKSRLSTGLNMIAAARLYLHDVNIASTTALQALAPDGRERGILAGANVMMPNVTDVRYRASYRLYRGKPCLDENASMCRGCLERRLASIGESVNYGQRGDSLHFKKRMEKAG